MKDSTSILPVIALFIFITLYWYWIFELVDHLLDKSRLSKFLRLPVGIFNVLFVFVLSGLIGGTMIPYLLVIILLIVEFHIFYRDTFLRNLFCTAACVIHILALRLITNGMISISCGLSLKEISNNPTLYAYSVLATFIFLNIAIGFAIKAAPLDQVRKVNEHRDQQLFLLIWMVINISYLLFNSYISEESMVPIEIIKNQIASPCVILIGTYIMLLFAMKTGKLLSYKEKNAALELTVSKEQEYRSLITKDAILTYEFNLNQNLITKGFEDLKDEMGNMVLGYSDTLAFMARKYIHPEDIEDFSKYVSPSNIKKELNQGKSEITTEYRQILSSGEYIWCRAVTNLARDAESTDIHGFTYIKNIDTKKRRQLELQYKAERDSLTGLYNKGITDKLINEHLLFNHTHSTGALFMIDVDNFKDINDHLGHAFGDSVLYELGQRLLSVFRNDDIVGRIGGDEYIAYMKHGITEKIVREKGGDVCNAFRKVYKDAQGQEHRFSGSIGVAISPKDGITFEELYKHADIALYAAKKLGKNNCQVYDGGSFNGYQANRNESL